MNSVNAVDFLQQIKDLEAKRSQMKLLLTNIDKKKWVNIDKNKIHQYSKLLILETYRLPFLENTTPQKIEFNMAYIEKYNLKEEFNKPIHLRSCNFSSFTKNFYFDIVYDRYEEHSINQFYRRYIERKQLEKEFDAYVIELFGSLVENPLEKLDLKITAMYEELALSL